MGSGSRIVCPPASVPPASRTFDEAPPKISARTSRGRSSGNAAIERAKRTRPPIAKTSREGVGGGDLAERPRVVDERREEVERADDREVVADAVGRGVVGWVQPGDQGGIGVGRSLRTQTAQRVGEQVRPELRGAPATVGEVGQPERVRRQGVERRHGPMIGMS